MRQLAARVVGLLALGLLVPYSGALGFAAGDACASYVVYNDPVRGPECERTEFAVSVALLVAIPVAMVTWLVAARPRFATALFAGTLLVGVGTTIAIPGAAVLLLPWDLVLALLAALGVAVVRERRQRGGTADQGGEIREQTVDGGVPNPGM